MSEDPLRNACLNPRSLVMTRSECFYCFAPEGVHCAQVDYNFGIKSCDYHYSTAVRDCNAYLHREKIVPVDRALKHPKRVSFFDNLPKTFPVLRSSGVVELDWALNEGNYPYIENLSYTTDSWSLPVRSRIGDIRKQILLTDFLKPQIRVLMPEGFDEEVNKANSILNSGLYSEENALYQTYINDSSLADVPDIREIKTILFNGMSVRVFI